MKPIITILHLEDNPDDANLIQTTLKHSGMNFNIIWVDSKEKFEVALLNPEIEIVLADYTIPNYNGLAALSLTREKRPNLPFILISGTIGEEKAIEVFHAGATDYINKTNLQRIEPAISRALKEIEEKNQRETAEKKLKETELLFRQFTENIHEVFWRTTGNLDRVIYVSPAYEKIWGRSIEEIYKNPNAWFEAVVSEDQASLKETLLNFIAGNQTQIEYVYRISRPDGDIRNMLTHAVKIYNANGFELIGVATDDTEREKSRIQLLASLKEKEVMLKEIYHRVKNNLQVVSSLLNLQARSIQDPISKKIFIESSGRVKAMALVHEMLYRSGDLLLIDMVTYVNDLLRNLKEIYHIESNFVKFVIDVEGVRLNLDNAIPCGLIINELISNSFKYAFPDKQLGEVSLSIKKNQNVISLVYKDNGIGVPENINFGNTKTLGLQLINSLTKQLDGNIVLDRKNGTTFILNFPTKS